MKPILLFLVCPTLALAGWQWTNELNQAQWSPSQPEGGYLPGSLHEVAAPPAAPDPLPSQFEFGIVTLDDQGHWVEHVPVENAIVPVQVSNSPLTQGQYQQMLAAGVATAKAERVYFRTELAGVRDNILTNIAQTQAIAFTNTAAAAQGDQIRDLRRELIDTQQELNRLRRILAQYIRGQ